MNSIGNFFICTYFFIFLTSTLFGSDLKPPRLTPYTQNLVERTRLGTVEERKSAIEECGVSKFSVCYYVLIELLNDPSPEIRKRSALSLGLIRIASAIPHIEKALNEEKEESVQVSLIGALAFLRSPDKSAPALAAKYLDANSDKIRYAAARVLTINVNNNLYDAIMGRIQNETNDKVKIVLLHAALKIKQTETEIKSLIKYFYSTQRDLRMVSAKAASSLQLKEFLQPIRSAIMVELDLEVLEEFYQAYNLTFFR
jgi:HEAT repeat protein